MKSTKIVANVVKAIPLKKWKLVSADNSFIYWQNGCACGSSGDGESDHHVAGSRGFVNYSARSGDYSFLLSRSYKSSNYTSGENYDLINLDVSRRGRDVSTPSGIDVEELFQKVSKNAGRRN